MEGSSDESNVDYGGLVQKASEGKTLATELETCDSLTKHMATFCPYPKNLPEANLNFGGANLLAEILSQPKIDSATRLLRVTLMKVCNEKRASKAEKNAKCAV